MFSLFILLCLCIEIVDCGHYKHHNEHGDMALHDVLVLGDSVARWYAAKIGTRLDNMDKQVDYHWAKEMCSKYDTEISSVRKVPCQFGKHVKFAWLQWAGPPLQRCTWPLYKNLQTVDYCTCVHPRDCSGIQGFDRCITEILDTNANVSLLVIRIGLQFALFGDRKYSQEVLRTIHLHEWEAAFHERLIHLHSFLRSAYIGDIVWVLFSPFSSEHSEKCRSPLSGVGSFVDIQ